MTTDPWKRAGRTLAQASFVAAVVAALNAFGLIHWTPEQTAAFMAVATPLVSAAQNAIEEATGSAMLPK